MREPRKVTFEVTWAARAEDRDAVSGRLRALVDALRPVVPWFEPLYVEGIGRVLAPCGHNASPVGRGLGESRLLAGGRRSCLALRAGSVSGGLPNHVRLDLVPPPGELEAADVGRVARAISLAFDAKPVDVSDTAGHGGASEAA